MDRLYTAFVSSTFRDLVEVRKLVAETLLSQHCVPLGMEFFPSTGANQWAAILDSIDAADFCVFVVAGRYGSIVPEMSISWTHREFREAVSKGKPLVVLIHSEVESLPFELVEADADGRAQLRAFKAEVEATTGCRYFRNSVELIVGLQVSVAALKDQGRIDGWIPAGKRPVLAQETDFTHSYQEIEVEHRLRPSATDESMLDLHYLGRRRLKGNVPEGVKFVTQDFTRTSEALTFHGRNQPKLRLSEARRTGPGGIRLAEPRRTVGSAFVQDIQFEPPIGPGEEVDVSVEGFLPEYKYTFAEDVLLAGSGSLLGPTGFDFVSRLVSFPTELLTMRVFLPNAIGSRPAGPRVGRQQSVDDVGSAELVSAGLYTEWSEDVDGLTGTYMQLRVPKPRFKRTYRLCWTPPPRATRPTR